MRFSLFFYGIEKNGDHGTGFDIFHLKKLNITDASIQIGHRRGPFRGSQTRPQSIGAHFVRIGDKDISNIATKKDRRQCFI